MAWLFVLANPRSGYAADDHSLAALVKDLSAAAPADRVHAAEHLAELKAKAVEAVPALLNCLTDQEPGVRAAAASALGEIQPANEQVMAALLPLLRDMQRPEEQEPVAAYAARALAKVGEPLIAPMIEKLRDPDLEVVRDGALVLHEMKGGAAQAVPAIVALLPQAGDDARHMLLFTLMGIGSAAAPALPTLTPLLAHENFHTQYWTCRVLGEIGAPGALPAVPRLAELVGNGAASVRRNAAMALGKIGPAGGATALAALRQGLQDKLFPVQTEAAIGLGKFGPAAQAALPELQARLRQDQFHARIPVAMAIWRISGDAQPAHEVLLAELQSKDAPWDAAAACAELGAAAAPAVPQIAALLRTTSGDSRVFVAEALAGLGPHAQDAIPVLNELLTAADAETRELAQTTLRRIQAATAPQTDTKK